MCCFPHRINCCWWKNNHWDWTQTAEMAKNPGQKADFATQRVHPFVHTRFPWKLCHHLCKRQTWWCSTNSTAAWLTPALLAQIVKVKLLKIKKLRKSVIRQVLIFRSQTQNLSKIVSFWLHRYKGHEVYWCRKCKHSKIMKMEAQNSKSWVLFVTLQDTNTAKVHVKEFPSTTTTINIQKLGQKYNSKWLKAWWKGKKSQRMNSTYSRLQEKEQQVVSLQWWVY